MKAIEELEAALALLKENPDDYRANQMFCGQAFAAMPALIECAKALEDIHTSSDDPEWVREMCRAALAKLEGK